MNKQHMKFAIAFAIGIMVVIGVQAYQQSQLDAELYDSPYKLTVRLARRSSAFEWGESSTTTITVVDADGNTVEAMTLHQPVHSEARQASSILYATRWEWATYTLKVEKHYTFGGVGSAGTDFDAFTFQVNPYLFTENDDQLLSSSIEIIYCDNTHTDFLIWIGLGY